MPGPLRTRDFAQRLARTHPDLPVLFTSGYTENAIVHHGRLDEGVNLISKPYAKADLARKLTQLLAQRPVGAG
jgi:CheY-like chemotaxis protein